MRPGLQLPRFCSILQWTTGSLSRLPFEPNILIPYISRSERDLTSGHHSRYYTPTALAMAASSPSNPLENLVQHSGKEFMVVKEGLAHILYPPSQEAASKGTKKDLKAGDDVQSVFYNPIQQFNRDLSVLAVKAFGEHVLAERKLRFEKRKRKLAENGSSQSKKRKREEQDTNAPRGEADEVRTEPASERVPVEQQTTPSFTILDALSATGLRALRYAHEVPFATSIVANDLSPSAIESMKTNIEYNRLGNLVRPNVGDARAYMYSVINAPQKSTSDGPRVGKFDAIDLDPYGTAAPFMDAAVQAVKEGGLLCITCTDAAVWASNGYPEKAFALYGGVPVKGIYSHEVGLRLILHALATSAAKYGLAIEPLLSLSIDFYARVFVRIHRSPAEVKFISGNTILVYNCDQGCGAWLTQPLTQTRQKLDKKGNPFYGYSLAQGPVSGPNCNHCGFKTHIGGPMWGGPLHNPHFIQKILDMLPGADRDVYKTVDRIEGMLTTALEEDLDLAASTKEPTVLHSGSTEEPRCPEQLAIIPRADPAVRESYPFYFSLSALAKILHAQTMQIDAFRGALRHLGYRSTRSHAKPNTIRTDAPWDVIWEIMREWVRQKAPVKDGSIRPGTVGAAIMAKSRENLRKTNEENQLLSLLKTDIMTAVQTGKDVGDLVTKVEAALYRSGSRQISRKDSSEIPDVSHNKGELLSTAPDSEQPRSPKTTSSEKPHPSTLDIIFDEALGREVSAANTKKRLVRYQMNPRANWGPLNRATGNVKKVDEKP